MRAFTASGKTVSVFPGGVPGAPAIYLNTNLEEAPELLPAVRKAGCPAFTLVAVSGLDWDRDLAPWDAPAAFPNARPFTGGAGTYLRILTEEILPEAERELPAPPLWRGIAGYSLAGLFAVYALYQTDLFSRAASVSGSLWFPGMREYFLSHRWRRPPDRVYFSLGDREGRTRNPCLRDVQSNTEEMAALYRNSGVDTVFQLNPGNHFAHTAARTAAGIAWLLRK